MKIAFVSSKGGHLGQIRILFTKEVIGKNEAVLITESTQFSSVKKNGYFLKRYPAYFFLKDELLNLNPFVYARSLIRLYKIFKKEGIDMVVTNGAQLSIPAVIAAKFLGIRVVFIDTIVRVKTPNWSARLCYFFSDIFLVQHRSMMKVYGPKARYEGAIL